MVKSRLLSVCSWWVMNYNTSNILTLNKRTATTNIYKLLRQKVSGGTFYTSRSSNKNWYYHILLFIKVYTKVFASLLALFPAVVLPLLFPCCALPTSTSLYMYWFCTLLIFISFIFFSLFFSISLLDGDV